jgi:type IV pilus biogenesis protein CpaD/CtpE
VLALFAVSCTNNMLERKMTLQDDFGNAVKTNIAAQTINPDAGKEPVPVATRDGQKTEQALKQYRTDTGEASSDSILEDIAQ